jgi:hypothetical protein
MVQLPFLILLLVVLIIAGVMLFKGKSDVQ